MTIGTGRQFAAQKLFGLEKELPLTSASSLINPSNFKIDSFGIGKGGSTINLSGAVTIISPSVCDLALNSPLSINNLAKDDSSGNKNVVKMIKSSLASTSPVGNIELISSSSSEYVACPSTYYTIVKCTCIVGPNEPMGLDSILDTGKVEKVDEAMLFATSNEISEAAVVIPFAHICFAPKYIEPESILTIEWNVIF
jgi:hypothetical protein